VGTVSAPAGGVVLTATTSFVSGHGRISIVVKNTDGSAIDLPFALATDLLAVTPPPPSPNVTVVAAAVVLFNGDIVSQKGFTGVPARLSTGIYELELLFPLPAAQTVPMLTPREFRPGLVMVATVQALNRIRVSVVASAGPVDIDFFIQVASTQ
jgi:hypothetical protein